MMCPHTCGPPVDLMMPTTNNFLFIIQTHLSTGVTTIISLKNKPALQAIDYATNTKASAPTIMSDG